MYRAKELGRSRYELLDETSRQRALHRLELETALGHAIERDELRILYQPKISLNGPAGVAGLEALVRWEHPERGLIAPSEFIPLAEETGIVHAIGEFVLHDALAQVVRWRRSRPRDDGVDQPVLPPAGGRRARDAADERDARQPRPAGGAVSRDHRGRGDAQPRRRDPIAGSAQERSVSRSRSTTTAPARPRWRASSGSRSTR